MNKTKQVKVISNLSQDEIDELRNDSFELTNRDYLQSICNHRKPGGMEDSLIYDKSTGIVKCYICGIQFKPINLDEDIKNKDIDDIFQTMKLMDPNNEIYDLRELGRSYIEAKYYHDQSSKDKLYEYFTKIRKVYASKF